MSALPTGTITFVFTDIVDSTRLWEEQPDQMKRAHARHTELIVACVRRHGGVVVRERGEGDSTFSVFSVATDALAAVCAVQRAFVTEAWPAEAVIRIRAALHVGTANVRDDDYNSSDVNRCARLRAIAHGGQTVLSQTVYDLTRDGLPDAVTLKDMGPHRLKSLKRPEQVYQLLHPDLPAEFPPLVSLDKPEPPNNLPRQLTSFIGRQKEMDELSRLLLTTCMLTITGTGGCGKTRLALQFASGLIEEYSAGVWLVELASLRDSVRVPQLLATAMGVREELHGSLLDSLTSFLNERTSLANAPTLLILDNCEHLLDACAALVALLLRGCPGLKIVATTREILNTPGELVWHTPSLLSLNLEKESPVNRDIAAICLEYDAIHLFVERCMFHRPAFNLNSQNLAGVAEICQRLDGIPLAIELAAARIHSMTVQQIASRLDDRFRLLTGGIRTSLPRQQTLRATMDWSYDLLSAAEQLLLCRISVFVGGWTFEATEAQCTNAELENSEVLDILGRLVQKSLVRYSENGEVARYSLLETVRQYARERLEHIGQAEQARNRHMD